MRGLLAIHWPIVGIAAALAGTGVLFIASATEGSRLYEGYATRQAAWLVVAVLAGALAYLAGYRRTRRVALPLLGAALVLLGLVFIVGADAKGARRWLPAGPVRVQPSELAKVALVLTLARILSVPGRGRKAAGVLQAFAVTGLTMIPIVLQPDLGTALALVPVVLGMTLVAGASARLVGGVVLAGCAALPLLYEYGMHDYQRDRLRAFLDPEAYAADEGYQSVQAFVAVGDGGVAGRGLFQGSQNRYDFLPDRHTDFIFCVLAEEWGLIGAATVLGLYALLALFTLEVASRAPDAYGGLVAAGLGALIFSHVAVNVGMAIGLAPVTGLPLPLLSYGGTALVANGAAIGLILSVHERSQ